MIMVTLSIVETDSSSGARRHAHPRGSGHAHGREVTWWVNQPALRSRAWSWWRRAVLVRLGGRRRRLSRRRRHHTGPGHPADGFALPSSGLAGFWPTGDELQVDPRETLVRELLERRLVHGVGLSPDSPATRGRREGGGDPGASTHA
jgi:hypothetical protein